MSPRCGHPKHHADWRCTEQKPGGFKMNPQWEMCIPIESSVWFWAGGKAANTKDVERCVKLLVMCASGDGNLLLDIRPMPDGRIQPLQAEILRGIGAWLKRYGESIYATRGGPYKPGPWGGATRQGSKVYLHVLQGLQGGKLTLPVLPAKIVGHRMLTGGSVKVDQSGKDLTITFDETACAAPIDRIVELELDRDALELEPIETDRPESLTEHATATASSEYSYKRPSGKRVQDSAANVVGTGNAYWTARANDPTPWIAVDLGKPATFQQIYLVEKYTRIRKFEVRCYDSDSHRWRTVFDGGRMNYCSVRLAEPVTARKIRVNVLKTAGGPPQISRLDLCK